MDATGLPARLPHRRELADALIARAEEYSRLTGIAITTISGKAVRDKRFLYDMRKDPGINFTIDRYQRIVDWLEANWPSDASAPEEHDAPTATLENSAAA